MREQGEKRGNICSNKNSGKKRITICSNEKFFHLIGVTCRKFHHHPPLSPSLRKSLSAKNKKKTRENY